MAKSAKAAALQEVIQGNNEPGNNEPDNNEPDNNDPTNSAGTSVAKVERNAALKAQAAAFMSKVKVKQRVTMPTLSLSVDVGYFLRIDSPMKKSTFVDPNPKKAKEEPATVCSITDMMTQREMLLLVPTVMEKNLRETYPDNAETGEVDTYVGKIFAVKKLPQRAGKRYFDLELAEVEIDE